MASSKWIQVDRTRENLPYWLDLDHDIALYMHEKTIGGYDEGVVNQKIINFKHKWSKFDTPCWSYKLRACQEFAEDLALLDSDITITTIPTSKTLDAPDFDPRFQILIKKLRPLVKRFSVVDNLIIRTESIQAVHEENSRSHRNPDSLIQAMQISSNAPLSLDKIVLVDDVLTSGANFKACEKLLKQRYPNIKVYGVFWAIVKHE